MKLKNLVTAVILSLFLSFSTAYSATVKATWDPYVGSADYLAIWELVDGGRVIKVPNIDPSTTEVTFEIEDKCGNYIMTAVRDSAESEASEVHLWCPPIDLPKIKKRPSPIKGSQIEEVPDDRP